jgi:hypothetical protein
MIIDAASLAAMKPTAYLINVARGRLVKEVALIDALRSNHIAGAGLDVTAEEPLKEDSPLWDMPNVIITPHVAPGTDAIGPSLVDFWSENIRRFAEQEPLLGEVDRNAGYRAILWDKDDKPKFGVNTSSPQGLVNFYRPTTHGWRESAPRIPLWQASMLPRSGAKSGLACESAPKASPTEGRT